MPSITYHKYHRSRMKKDFTPLRCPSDTTLLFWRWKEDLTWQASTLWNFVCCTLTGFLYGRYIESMYDQRKKWARCYTLGHFNASLQSTQRVECKFYQFKKNGWHKNSSLYEALERLFMTDEELEAKRILKVLKADIKAAKSQDHSFLGHLESRLRGMYHPWLSSFILTSLKSVPMNYNATKISSSTTPEGLWLLQYKISATDKRNLDNFITGPLDEINEQHIAAIRNANRVDIYASDVTYANGIIESVVPESYSEKVGIEVGDVVQSIRQSQPQVLSCSDILEVELRGPRSRRVTLNIEVNSQSAQVVCVSSKCSCMRDISFGLPCDHILSSLVDVHLNIPCQLRFCWISSLVNLIARRWSRMEECTSTRTAENDDSHTHSSHENRPLAEAKKILGRISAALDHLESAASDSNKISQVVESLQFTSTLLGINDGVIARGTGIGSQSQRAYNKQVRQHRVTEPRKRSRFEQTN